MKTRLFSLVALTAVAACDFGFLAEDTGESSASSSGGQATSSGGNASGSSAGTGSGASSSAGSGSASSATSSSSSSSGGSGTALGFGFINLPQGDVNVAYSFTLSPAGGRSPYTWRLENNAALPPGVTLNGAVLSGTPTTAGTFALRIILNDGAGAEVSANKNLIVRPANRAPVASNDAFNAVNGIAVDLPVLANDTDPDSDTLAVTITVPPLNGTATVLPSGQVRYTAGTLAPPSDSLTYRIADPAGLSSTAQVEISICTRQSDADFCNALSRECGTPNAADNCGVTRTVSCGQCTAPETCQNNGQCACIPETDGAMCLRLGAVCDSISEMDNCLMPRTVACGTCPGLQQCGAAAANRCACTDARFEGEQCDQCVGGGTRCGDDCVMDLQTSAEHCGMCGNNCEGATCVGGVCQRLMLATGLVPSTVFAVTTGRVHFYNSSGWWFVSTRAAQQTPTQSPVGVMAADDVQAVGATLYVRTGGALMALDDDGAQLRTVLASFPSTGPWAVDGTEVYFVSPSSAGTCPSQATGDASCGFFLHSACRSNSTCTLPRDGAVRASKLDGSGTRNIATGVAIDTDASLVARNGYVSWTQPVSSFVTSEPTHRRELWVQPAGAASFSLETRFGMRLLGLDGTYILYHRCTQANLGSSCGWYRAFQSTGAGLTEMGRSQAGVFVYPPRAYLMSVPIRQILISADPATGFADVPDSAGATSFIADDRWLYFANANIGEMWRVLR